ncbi:MAG: phasin family protein [Pseudomonadota bacterium]
MTQENKQTPTQVSNVAPKIVAENVVQAKKTDEKANQTSVVSVKAQEVKKAIATPAVKNTTSNAKPKAKPVAKPVKSVATKASSSTAAKASLQKAKTPAKPVLKSSSFVKPTSASDFSAKAFDKTANVAISNLQVAQKSTKAVVDIGAGKIKEIFSSSINEAKKSQSKAFDATREGTENLTRLIDVFENTVNEVASFGRKNIDIALDVSNIIADIASNSSEEIVKNANHAFSRHIDICNEIFTCKNITDASHIGNKLSKNYIDNIFSQSSVFLEFVFELASEASEPVNENIIESTERFYKTLAA